MRLRRLPTCSAILFLALTVMYPPQSAWGADKASRPPAPVRVKIIKRQDIPRTVHTVGTVLASATVQIKSLVEGHVLEAGFQGGQIVKKGDLLFRIDPLPFTAELNQAKAILARDKAQLKQALLQLKRQKNLSKRGVASAQKYEEAQADAQALTATVDSDIAAVNSARLELGHTIIRSPLTGKTSAIMVDPGNTVKVNADDPMVTVYGINPVRVSTNLPQKYIPELQKLMAVGGTTLEISIPGDKKPPLIGHVDFIAASVNQMSGTIEIRATVDNPDQRLVVGQFVTGKLVLEDMHNVLIVPFDAISSSQNGPYVYTVGPDQKTKLHYVKILYSDKIHTVIADGSVKSGEQIVIEGHLRLADGLKVQILKAQP